MKSWALILSLALGLRLVGINQSFWQDEALTANLVVSKSYEHILNEYSPVDFHPPLYYVVLKTWSNVFGGSEISLRIPSIIFGVLTVAVVYLMAGSWAAALTAVNPLLIYYSQEARMYSMATFFVTLGVYFWQKRNWLWMNVAIIISFLTFYGTAFIWGAMILIGVWQAGIGFFIAIGFISPLLIKQLTYSRIALNQISNWSHALGAVTIKNLLLIPIKFSVGRISFYPKVVYWIVSGLATLIVGLGIIAGAIKEKRKILLVLTTLGLGVVFSVFSPMLSYFRFLYLIPVLMMVAAESRLKKLIGLSMLIFSLTYLVFPKFHREDWKSLSNSLEKKIYIVESLSDPIRYYRPDVQIKDLRGLIDEEKITVSGFGAEIHGLNYKQKLIDLGYRQIKATNFRELQTEEWIK